MRFLRFELSVLAVLLLPQCCLFAQADDLSQQDIAEQEIDASVESDSGEPDSSESDSKASLKMESSFLSAFPFRSIGPAMTSGRIGDIAIDHENPNVWYVGVASGNLWKTKNSGTTFEPIFDNYGSYSIGCVTIDPSHSDTIWVGTGENNGGRHIGFGDGIYRSLNGGVSFENMGLKNSEHISKILVDPRDSKTVFAASQGPLWSGGGERGLFKSTDHGKTWKNVLSKGPYTGVTDVVFDPTNPDVLYAATHQRQRTVAVLLNTGPETGIFKSTDGGETWRELTGGIPGGDKGKISLGVSAQDNNVVYASIELVNREGGFYRSSNGGESFRKMSDFVSGGTGPHYYQEIYVDPHRFDVIYHANNTLVRSEDGGKTFEPVEGRYKHVDNHAVVFHPQDDQFVLVGCDGGVYLSHDYCGTWQYFSNLPVTQFYKVDVDYDLPFYHVVGGTQDNNSQYGPTATRYVQGIVNSDWQITIGGDGHDNAIDPENPDIIYCESQQGYIQRFDRKTGESMSIRPAPNEDEGFFRFNWDSPILISPHDSKRIYFASNYLHRSDDRGDSWKKISPDLSQAIDRWSLPIMGRVWGIDAGFDLYAMSAYGNITSISESPQVEGLIYVGTDDGLIQVTEDGGETWTKIDRFFDVPKGAFINDVKADRHDADTVYACLDDHKTGDYKPYVIKSTDRGRTWKSIASDLPDRHLIWRLEQDHVEPNLLFLGTEFGVFASVNGGENWLKLSAGMPNIPVRDLAIQKRENDLVAATFGRGFYVLDDYSALRSLTAQNADTKAALFPIRRSWWYDPADRLGGRKGYQGDGYFTADNPTYGSVFTVYLSEKFESKASARKKAAAEAKKNNQDTPLVAIDDLIAEDREILPTRYVEISDASSQVVARVNLPNSKGVHRVSWDFRGLPLGGAGPRPLCGPGTYFAKVCQRTSEEITELTQAVEFVVEQMIDPTLPAMQQDEIRDYQEKVYTAIFEFNEATEEFETCKTTLEESITAVGRMGVQNVEISNQLQELLNKCLDMELQLNGNPQKQDRFIEEPLTTRDRYQLAFFGSFSTHGPTQTHQEQLEIASRQAGELLPKLRELCDAIREQVAAVRESGVLIAVP